MSSIVDKTTVLDSCVDGDETCFGNLVGENYDEFNLVYGVVKKNKDKLLPSKIQCRFLKDNKQLSVTIPMKKNVTMTKLELPSDKPMDAMTDGNNLVLNITVKKEW